MSDTTPQQYAPVDLPTELPTIEAGEYVTIPVERSDAAIKTDSKNGSDSTTVLAAGLAPDDLQSDQPYTVTGTIATSAVGVDDDNYLVFDTVETVETRDPVSDTEVDCEDETGTSTDLTTDSSVASPGVKIKKDGHGERRVGSNPVSDPNLVKDAGLHQGGN